ncbi:MAG: thiol oxidoreductase, partial [Acidobacteria bacterium]|nr:thiol oxidoreductase [Acidobacteriota bacterium]
RDATPPGGANALASKGISFGTIARFADGTWNTAGVQGIPASSLVTTGATNPPSLIIRPFHQAGRVISVREFTNNAFNHHHGIQPTERFGIGTDSDGDGFVNELTRADVTAASVFQATLAVPGRVIPNDPAIEAAVLVGEQRFQQIQCASCHVPSLPLDNSGWIFTEPNPFNPPGNLRPGDAPSLAVNLTGSGLPQPRLQVQNGVVYVPAFTDLKLHDITSGPGDPNVEPLDMQQPPGSLGFFAGNRKFITRKLWGTANEPPFFHHGQFTTMREAILAHAGEALASRNAFQTLSSYEQNSIIEFLKTLQVLPPGTKHLIVDENGNKKIWPSS